MEERLAALGARIIREDEKNDDIGRLTVVRIPADVSLGLQELVFVESTGILADLEDILQSYFAILPDSETINLDLLKEQANQARVCTTYTCPHVSPATLQRAAEEGTLQRSQVSESEEDDIIYLYWDESAPLKQRPRNVRAMQYANKNCEEEEDVYGDAFLVKVSKQTNQLISLQLRDLLKKR